ncbi:MAG: hydroxysqualene dehydroxylase HpnE [Planctomycetota bacterium]
MTHASPVEHVAIVGGGIAGIAAAVRLVEAGVRVTVLETRTKLGGRATSFDDVRTGLTIDNCQHVALRCCTNFLDLLERIGASRALDWQSNIYWYESGGRRSVMKRTPAFPAPGHYSISFLTAKFLTPVEKARIAFAMLAILRADREHYRDITLAAWLRERWQSERVISKFWEPVVVSACNLSCDRVDACAALHVFQEGFLARADSAEMGVPNIPLRELYDGAIELIESNGSRVRLRSSVKRIFADRVELSDGEIVSADRVICAVPPERAIKIIDQQAQHEDERFASISGLTHSPILGVHIVFDRPVMRTENAVLVERETQWLFRKDEAGREVHAVISGADGWLGLSEQDITDRVVADIRACHPWAEGAAVVSSRPVMEKRATWAPIIGSESKRPTSEGESKILLAGCYVQTGWPATMEGATRSGYAAAESVLGTNKRFVQPACRSALLVRFLGGKSISRQGSPAGG